MGVVVMMSAGVGGKVAGGDVGLGKEVDVNFCKVVWRWDFW